MFFAKLGRRGIGVGVVAAASLPGVSGAGELVRLTPLRALVVSEAPGPIEVRWQGTDGWETVAVAREAVTLIERSSRWREGEVRIAGGERRLPWKGGAVFESWVPLPPVGKGAELATELLLVQRHEVSNAQYLAYCQATASRRPSDPNFAELPAYLETYPGHPVVGVSWYEAQAYGAWRGDELGVDGAAGEVRLPTEEEWVYAARGDRSHWRYPWGEVDSTWAHEPERDLAGLLSPGAPAPLGGPRSTGSHPAGATLEGVHDLIGNAAEWCADRPAGSPVDRRAVRGGSWADGLSGVHIDAEGWVDASARLSTLGFRLVRRLPLPRLRAEPLTSADSVASLDDPSAESRPGRIRP